MEIGEYRKSGFLNDEFHFFHIRDSIESQFEYHYHEFDKIIIFFSGHVIYQIEGKDYHLNPWDILLVNHHDIHKPIIDKNYPYDRIVIWIHREFLNKYDCSEYQLSHCFNFVNENRCNLLRMSLDGRERFACLLSELEISIHSKGYANKLLSSTLFLQLMIYLNRILIQNALVDSSTSIHSDELIDALITYINNHLCADLSIEALSQKFYCSKSYLMHKFKNKTGCSIHNYIQKKRLSKALDLIKKKEPITSACLQCGFTDYSTFSRAFHRIYHCSPSDLCKS